MKDDAPLQHWLNQVKIIRPPRHLLSTFGTTTLHYHVVSEMPASGPGTSRLRTGRITAEKPKILTPQHLQEHFQGFGEDTEELRRQMETLYGDSIRALGYIFRNELEHVTLEHTAMQPLVDRIVRQMDESNAPREALLQAPESAWSLAIMKFMIDTSLRSFPSNVRELDERGMFDPSSRQLAIQRREIERLFREASANPALRQVLGEKLRSWGLFQEYEDRFFALF